MKTLLSTAIEGRRLVHLLYEGRSRTVEPYVMGRNERNEDIVLCRQISPWVPEDKSWHVFRLGCIYGLLVLETNFKRPQYALELPAELLTGIRLVV